MTLIWTRIDQKLIHGQVSVAWVPRLNIDAIVVTDQDTAADPWAQKVMLMGLPPEVRVARFVPPTQLAGLLAEAEMASRRVLVLFKSLEGFLEAAAAGFYPVRLNLGNQAGQPPERDIRLSDCFYASSRDLRDLSVLSRAGLEVVIQAVPTGKPVKWKPAP